MLRLLMLVVLFPGALQLWAQTDTITKYEGVQLRLHYGFIFAHSQAVQNTAGAHPKGLEIDILKQRVDSSAWDICRCFPKKGLSLSYFDFNTQILGKGVTASYFLEPSYKLSKRTQFGVRGSIGLSYLTNPYDLQTSPTNQSYSTHLSGYLQLGVGVSYQVASKWLLQLGGQYQHLSNGGFKEPNKGINWPTASVGISHYTSPYNLPSYRPIKQTFKSRKSNIEGGVFFAAKQGYKLGGETPRTALIGTVIHVEKQVGKLSALNAGIETYYDNALYQQLKADSLEGVALPIGIIGGHTFLLGKMLFTQQLGVYVLNRPAYNNRLYHRWLLRYILNDKASVGLGFKAHKQVADFFDLRLMYRLLN